LTAVGLRGDTCKGEERGLGNLRSSEGEVGGYFPFVEAWRKWHFLPSWVDGEGNLKEGVRKSEGKDENSVATDHTAILGLLVDRAFG